MRHADHGTRLLVAKAWSENIADFVKTAEICELETAIIMLGVMIGDLEQRPVDISTLALMVGVPRSTVKRKLERLEKRGVVNITASGQRKVISRVHSHDVWERLLRFMIKRTRRICEQAFAKPTSLDT